MQGFPRSNRQKFGSVLRDLRTSRRLSQAELGAQIPSAGKPGVFTSQATISAWESGQTAPTAEQLFLLEEILGVRNGTLSRHLGNNIPSGCPNCGTELVHYAYDCILDDPDLSPLEQSLFREMYLVIVKHARRRNGRELRGPCSPA